MKKNILLLGVLSLAVLASNVALAGNRPGAITFTMAGGAYGFSSKRHMENAGVPNVALAYNFTDRWAIEGDIGVINTHTQAPLAVQGVHGAIYTLDAIYRFKPYKVVEPYISGGLGELTLSPNGFNSEHSGNVNVGVGTQVFLDPSIALRAELRDIYTLAGGFNDGMANFGVSFLFDS